MRLILPITAAVAAASCTMAPPPAPAPMSPAASARLSELLAGRVPGPPQTCLPNWRANQMIVIDDNTILYRESPGRIWMMKPQGGPCDRLGSFTYALVTRTMAPQLCQGDIAQVMDTTTNTMVGSCVIGQFVPYTRVGG